MASIYGLTTLRRLGSPHFLGFTAQEPEIPGFVDEFAMSLPSSSQREAGLAMKPMRVAVVGAGASGLVTAKYLSQAKEYFGVPAVEIRIFEREEGIGGVYKYKVYEEAEVSSEPFTVSQLVVVLASFTSHHLHPALLPLAPLFKLANLVVGWVI